MGTVARNQGHYNRAVVYHKEALNWIMQTDDRTYRLTNLFELGTSSIYDQNYEQGRHCFVEHLTLSSESSDFACCLEGPGGLAAAQKQPERAARLLGAAEALREAANAPRAGLDRYYEPYVTMTQEQLDATTFAAAWAEGAEMTLEQAVAYALAEPS